MKKYISLSILSLLFLISCQDLDLNPKDKFTATTTFKVYDNFKTYTWGLYSIFGGYNAPIREQEVYANVLVNATPGSENIWGFQRATEVDQSYDWNFGYIRQVNSMLDNIDQSDMSQTDKNHWRSVGLFFRSYRYFQLLSEFGDVTWLEHIVSETDSEIMFGKRTPRDIVAKNILRDLVYAETNIKRGGDGDNTINEHCVRALISRFGLFEGTWRKYRELSDADIYLQASITYSEKVLEVFTEIQSNYDDVYNSEDLKGAKGVLLYKSYVPGQSEHALLRDGHGGSFEMTQQTVDKYLCQDGYPISKSPLYQGDKTANKVFRNRDKRLLLTVIPPYRVAPLVGVGWTYLKSGDKIMTGTDTYKNATKQDSIDAREYIDLMSKIAKPGHKALPLQTWLIDPTLITSAIPQFLSFQDGPSAAGGGRFGYHIYRFYVSGAPQSTKDAGTDCPIFRTEEVMLNYAEAKYEMNAFDQSIADKTINKLRDRAGVAKMAVANIDVNFDLKRDQTVAPILWEIRRERMVELMFGGFAFDDIRRWKKGNYLNEQAKGCWVKNSDYGNSLMIYGNNSINASKDKEGYVTYFGVPTGWLDKYYLYPIPISEITLNPNLDQNPGYSKN
ncbi:MAG: RagB/SusD family nutrient uptake outer membrane protein [Paludibacter sp.]